jgi:hypothetical protein
MGASLTKSDVEFLRSSRGIALIVLAGFTSGVGAASVNIAARFVSDPGDALGFFGGAFGAGAAVLGGLWLERLKNQKADNRRTDDLVGALLGVTVTAGGTVSATGYGYPSSVEGLAAALNNLQAVIGETPIPEPISQAILSRLLPLKEELSIYIQSFKEESRLTRSHSFENIAKTKAIALQLLVFITHMIETTDYWPPGLVDTIKKSSPDAAEMEISLRFIALERRLREMDPSFK